MFPFLYILFPFLLRFVLARNSKFVYGFAEWECWKLTPLGRSPYIFHSHRMGNATMITYKPKTNGSFTSVPLLLASYHRTP